MGTNFRQYIFGLIFFAVGIYHVVTTDYLEASLYIMAGLSFVVNQLAGEPKLALYKKQLVLVTWVLIVVTLLLFLYLMQFKYF